jgi:hypothetical protein
MRSDVRSLVPSNIVSNVIPITDSPLMVNHQLIGGIGTPVRMGIFSQSVNVEERCKLVGAMNVVRI